MQRPLLIARPFSHEADPQPGRDVLTIWLQFTQQTVI